MTRAFEILDAALALLIQDLFGDAQKEKICSFCRSIGTGLECSRCGATSFDPPGARRSFIRIKDGDARPDTIERIDVVFALPVLGVPSENDLNEILRGPVASLAEEIQSREQMWGRLAIVDPPLSPEVNVTNGRCFSVSTKLSMAIQQNSSATFLVAQQDGFELDWKEADVKPFAVIRYKTKNTEPPRAWRLEYILTVLVAPAPPPLPRPKCSVMSLKLEEVRA